MNYNNDLNKLEMSIKRLEGIRNVLNNYGISRPMMEAADPKNELVDAGICCSYEQLGLEYVKDDNAKMALEGVILNLHLMVAAVFTIYGVFFHKATAKMISDNERILRIMHNAEVVLNSRKSDMLHNPKFDKVRFEHELSPGYTKEDFKEAVKAFAMVTSILGAGKLLKLVEDVLSAIANAKLRNLSVDGLAIKFEAAVRSLRSAPHANFNIYDFDVHVYNPEDGIGSIFVKNEDPDRHQVELYNSDVNLIVYDLGYSVDDMHNLLDEGFRTLNSARAFHDYIVKSSVVFHKVHDAITTYSQKTVELTHEEKKKETDIMKALQRVVQVNNELISKSLHVLDRIYETIETVTNKAMECVIED